MRVTSLLVLLLVSACGGGDPSSPEVAGGNSGGAGPAGGGAVPCPCQPLGPMVRSTIVSVDGPEFGLRVVDFIGEPPASLGLATGDEFTVSHFDRLPCYRGVTGFQVGDEVLAFLRLGNKVSDGRWTDIRLTAWGPELLMAETDESRLVVPAGALDALAPDDECIEMFGTWTDLPGYAPDGSSDEYWCTSGGREYVCVHDE